MSVTQRKELGTTVDFQKAKGIKDFKKICYRGDNIGILAYQKVGITVSSAQRDALLNGNLADIANQTSGQGMQTNYQVISWLETAQGGNYYITDLRIGIVVQIARDYNTGPAYLLTSLEAVPWLNPILVAMSMTYYGNWQAWELTNMNRPEPTYLHMVEEMVSQDVWVTALVGTPLPDLPDASTTQATIMAQGDIQGALGKFVTGMSDKGVATTILGNGYGIDICYYKSNEYPVPGGGHGYYYNLHTRFWWDCTTNPDITIGEATRLGILIAIAVIIALAIAVGLVFAIPILAYNLSHQETSWTKKTTLPDGTVIEESGSSSGPPDWWGAVIPIVALIGVGAGVYLVLKYLPKGKEK